MATTNLPASQVNPVPRTHEGGVAARLTPEQELTRSVLACLLWEDSFYESGEDIADRITKLVASVATRPNGGVFLTKLVHDARNVFHMRHVPLLVTAAMAHAGVLKVPTVLDVVQRADELAELLAIYWKMNNRQGRTRPPFSMALKHGLAQAFTNFDAYQLAKYNRAKEVTLRDVMFLTHPKPLSDSQKATWEALINNSLAAPDTWEVNISALGNDTIQRKAAWERMLAEHKVTGLALLRNLHNMEKDGVEPSAIMWAIAHDTFNRVLPFRFILAADHASKQYEPVLEQAMMRAIDQEKKLPGNTAVLVDVSGSMDSPISRKSKVKRYDVAIGLAILAREICDNVRVLAFATDVCEVSARHGFALRDAIKSVNVGGGTNIGGAVSTMRVLGFDRTIVITDEQSHDDVGHPSGKGYMINVSAEKNGVGYGAWTHIDGFSESTLNYIREIERES